MSTAVMQTILSRRSVRRFQPEQLSDSVLEEIVMAGRYAPSGGNSQSTTFIVIQNHEVLDELAKLVESRFAQMTADENTYRSLRTSIQLSKKGGYVFHYHAPTLIVTANKRCYGNATADCAVAIENMLLAASSMNIGSCWINQLTWLTDDPPVRAYLQRIGLGSDEIVCGAAAFGFPDQKLAVAPERTGNPVIYIK